MLKWLGGCAVVAVILIVGGAYFAMRTVRESLSPDGSARVAIHAPPERVFASLASADSIPTYMGAGNKLTISRHGPLQIGDSIRVELRTTLGMKAEPMIWIVKEIVPNQKIVFQLGAVGNSPASAIKSDSLFAQGDSTIVIGRLAFQLADSAKASATSDMMSTMFQMQSKLELESLKIRIEGKAPPRRP
jgi:uncharacterized protein YndB with AHSA1/START domain